MLDTPNPPADLSPEQVALSFKAFEGESKDYGGLSIQSLILFMSYLVSSGGIQILGFNYQVLASSLISSGIIDFSGNIYIDFDSFDEDNDDGFFDGAFTLGDGTPT